MTGDHSHNAVRAEGPPMVVEGVPNAPTIVVMDPAGAAKHDELPATWRPLAERRRITWCRLPSEGAVNEVESVLSSSSTAGPVVDIVASGPFAETALLVAERHAHKLRSLLLVDPAAKTGPEADDAETEDRRWERDNAERRRRLEESGVTVRVIAHSTVGEFDRIPAPLPLGHPDVVAAIERTLDDIEPERLG
jgi:hypothetical protein